MAPKKRSVIRSVMRWWFEPPASPWVTYSVAIDFAPARDYLARLRAATGANITVHHLLAAAIGRVLREFPQANARLVAGKVRRVEEVGLAMPVSLLGHEAGEKRELSLALLHPADRLTLREIAERLQETVREERKGRPANRWIRGLMAVADRLPEPAIHLGLDALARAMRRPAFVERFYARIPITTALTNPGASIGTEELRHNGMLVRGGAFNVPVRPLHFGTLWGISAVQDEVVPVDGRPEVRPMLPVSLVFDHRLIDGVLAGKLMVRFAALLHDPEPAFGARGERAAE